MVGGSANIYKNRIQMYATICETTKINPNPCFIKSKNTNISIYKTATCRHRSIIPNKAIGSMDPYIYNAIVAWSAYRKYLRTMNGISHIYMPSVSVKHVGSSGQKNVLERVVNASSFIYRFADIIWNNVIRTEIVSQQWSH